ncbi:uncharacterized protein BDZ99DRAFT_381251 [Mytilinidion resinicola]|uniref:GST N-terminal domain-containing protein n=1 Tax=Mytilinidion resinicola TaxID=574789 RepID=A0A6A6YXI0_9PEZI|nr:uncharacterized protein BDZ99DRAFT_381251 [Mytilinidion resinicola]KAF2813531.1 hypothetical protein BDZ99DRAFT_381251 [Mytilinidion resinicola]
MGGDGGGRGSLGGDEGGGRLAREEEGEGVAVKSDGQFEGLKLIPNPPDLECWRQRLFAVDEMVLLSEEQFQTYFPHVDNVYSHRSTQGYKRKPFVSHYWDCRLKGRPPGTKKSTDPEKKKRKRVARERDLCDVKIKITEYLPGTIPSELFTPTPNSNGGTSVQAPTQQQLDALNAGGFYAQQGAAGEPWGMGSLGMGPCQGKWYTIQRVNGNGRNGKSVGPWVAGPHKHTLEESDRVKKNSVVRHFMKNERDKKKGGDPQKKTYHKKATGKAYATVKAHSKEEDLKLYGSCFCPFVQRVWISLELKGIPYQYIEVDPYKKPQSLLDVNPRGLVPALRHGPTWSCHESTVLMEYLEELQQGPPLLPADPQMRATCRLWSDHINRHLIPSFYRLLQSQDPSHHPSLASELSAHISTIVSAAESLSVGPFFLGNTIGFVDVQMAPWVIRLSRVLKPYRAWPEPEEGTRWKAWVSAIENEGSVERTTSTEELYLDSYERYAENRPDTSQLANAVNSGRGLP